MTTRKKVSKNAHNWQPTDQGMPQCDGMEISSYMHWWLTLNQKVYCPLEPCRLKQAGVFDRVGAGKSCEDIVPLPDFAVAPSGTKPETPKDLSKKTEKPPRDTVITGIIDEGIALGHARFRKLHDGKPTASRVIAAWQQGARFGRPEEGAPAGVPFGRLLLQSELNALIKANSADGWLDEDAFNIAAGLSDGSDPMGITTLDRLAAHGTHVLDLAAGFDPKSTDDVDLDRRPILAVTLPRREAVGMAGTFLQFFVVHAMQWIVETADALWAQHYPDEEGGFPVVINLSFGQHAGPKNGSSQIEEAFCFLSSQRNSKGPLRLVMPVGNDNLARGNAYKEFAVETSRKELILELPWRVHPQDQSPNFAEFWVEIDGPQPEMSHPLILNIELPDGRHVKDVVGKHRHYLDLPGAARIYAESISKSDPDDPAKTNKQLYHYIICTSATHDETGKRPVSPAGVWRISARWNSQDLANGENAEAKLYCSVQVDQAVEVGSLRNLRSYFDHSDYKTHDDVGRIVDTFRYPLAKNASDLLDGEKSGDVVQRRGTHNAVATADGIIVVGGYRLSDGRPAYYSATNHAENRTPYGAATRMTASLPTETAPSHFGIRAAGPRSAATISMRGTSFAAGLATRQIVEELLQWTENGSAPNYRDGSAQSYADQAVQLEKLNVFDGEGHPLKVGHGRIPVSPIRDVDRLTWGQDFN